MDEKIREIEFDILPLNYLNIFKAKEYIKYLISIIKELEGELDSEKKWAKEYFDKWEQTEARLTEITKKWESLKFKIFVLEQQVEKLKQAIDKHEKYRRSHDWVVSLEDELLYQTLNGMKCE